MSQMKRTKNKTYTYRLPTLAFRVHLFQFSQPSFTIYTSGLQGSAYKVGQHPPLILKWHTGPPPTPQASTLPTPPPALVAAERASSICSEGNSTPPVVRKKESSLELAEDEEEEDEEEEEGEDDDDESGDDDDELNVIINKDVVDEEHDESYEFGEAQVMDSRELVLTILFTEGF